MTTNNLAIVYEFRRPDTTVPWNFEYIQLTTDPELQLARSHFYRYIEITNGRYGWYAKFEQDLTNPSLSFLRLTYTGATSESINHQSRLYFDRYISEFEEWIKWASQYNAAHFITRVRYEDILTNSNSFLSAKPHTKIDFIGQNQLLDQIR